MPRYACVGPGEDGLRPAELTPRARRTSTNVKPPPATQQPPTSPSSDVATRPATAAELDQLALPRTSLRVEGDDAAWWHTTRPVWGGGPIAPLVGRIRREGPRVYFLTTASGTMYRGDDPRELATRVDGYIDIPPGIRPSATIATDQHRRHEIDQWIAGHREPC